MKSTLLLTLVLFLPGMLLSQEGNPEKRTIRLPEPRKESSFSLEKALQERRSVRVYTKESLSLADLSQLLWAAQGITAAGGLRTAPSAGALYPLEIYVVAGAVVSLPAGVYQYEPGGHKLVWKKAGDLRQDLYQQALRQEWVRKAPVCLVIAGVYERTTVKYGERGKRYVHMEVGHACENIYLQAKALGLGTVTIGAFQDKAVQQLLGMRWDERPFSLMPVGKVKLQRRPVKEIPE